MTPEVVRYEPWPAWAKMMLSGLAILAVISALPWIFMWSMGTMMGGNMSGMATACMAMMQRMGSGMMP